MSKVQKRALVVMVLLMVLVIGGVVFMVVQNNLNASRQDFQQQIDTMTTQAAR